MDINFSVFNFHNYRKTFITEKHNLGVITDNLHVVYCCGNIQHQWNNYSVLKYKVKNRSKLINEQVKIYSDVINSIRICNVQLQGSHL